MAPTDLPPPLSPDPASSSLAAATGDFSSMASPPSIVTDPDEPVTLLWRPLFERGEGVADAGDPAKPHPWQSEAMTFSGAMDMVRGDPTEGRTIYRVLSQPARHETQRTLRDMIGRRARNTLEDTECFACVDGDAVRLRPECMAHTTVDYAPPQDPIGEWEDCEADATWMIELACTLEFADHRCCDPWGQAGACYFGMRPMWEIGRAHV